VLELLQDGPMPVRDLLARIEVEPSGLAQQLNSARRILTEMLTGWGELLAELREAEVGA